MNPRSILLVEDDPTSARLYQTLFERQGWVVTVVADGSDAFMEAHHKSYDILLLDLMLPSMDGMAMLRRFRAQRRFARVPIFLYTAEDLARVEPLALEAGVTKVFSKTMPAREVVQAILESFSISQAMRARTADEGPELEEPTKPDFRVPAKSTAPLPALRMASEPVPPARPVPPPPPPAVEPPPTEESKGLLSRWFRSKSREE